MLWKLGSMLLVQSMLLVCSHCQVVQLPAPVPEVVEALKSNDKDAEYFHQFDDRTQSRAGDLFIPDEKCSDVGCTTDIQKEFTLTVQTGGGVSFTAQPSSGLRKTEVLIKVRLVETSLGLDHMYYSPEMYRVAKWKLWNADESGYNKCLNKDVNIEMATAYGTTWVPEDLNAVMHLRQIYYGVADSHSCNGNGASSNHDCFCVRMENWFTSQGFWVARFNEIMTHSVKIDVTIGETSQTFDYMTTEADNIEACSTSGEICLEIRMNTVPVSFLQGNYLIAHYSNVSSSRSFIEEWYTASQVAALGNPSSIGLGQFQFTRMDSEGHAIDDYKYVNYKDGPYMTTADENAYFNDPIKTVTRSLQPYLNLIDKDNFVIEADLFMGNITPTDQTLARGWYNDKCHLHWKSPSREQMQIQASNFQSFINRYGAYKPNDLPDILQIKTEGYPDYPEVVVTGAPGFIVQGTLTANNYLLQYSDGVAAVDSWNYTYANNYIGSAGSYIKFTVKYIGSSGYAEVYGKTITLLKTQIFLQSGETTFTIGYKNPGTYTVDLTVCIAEDCKTPMTVDNNAPPEGGVDNPDNSVTGQEEEGITGFWDLLIANGWVCATWAAMLLVNIFFLYIFIRIILKNLHTGYRYTRRGMRYLYPSMISLLILTTYTEALHMQSSTRDTATCYTRKPINAVFFKVNPIDIQLVTTVYKATWHAPYDGTKCGYNTNCEITVNSVDALPTIVTLKKMQNLTTQHCRYSSSMDLNRRSDAIKFYNRELRLVSESLELLVTEMRGLPGDQLKMLMADAQLIKDKINTGKWCDSQIAGTANKMIQYIKALNMTSSFEDNTSIASKTSQSFISRTYFNVSTKSLTPCAAGTTVYPISVNNYPMEDHVRYTYDFVMDDNFTAVEWSTLSKTGMICAYVIPDPTSDTLSGMVCKRNNDMYYSFGGFAAELYVATKVHKFYNPDSVIIEVMMIGINHAGLQDFCDNNTPQGSDTAVSIAKSDSLNMGVSFCVFSCPAGCTYNVSVVTPASVQIRERTNTKQRITRMVGEISQVKGRMRHIYKMTEKDVVDHYYRKLYTKGIPSPVARFLESEAEVMEAEWVFDTSIIQTIDGVMPAMVGGFVNHTCMPLSGGDIACTNGEAIAFMTGVSVNFANKIRQFQVNGVNVTALENYPKLNIYPNDKACTGVIAIIDTGKQQCSSDCCHITTDGWKTSRLIEPSKIIRLGGTVLSQDYRGNKRDYNSYAAVSLCSAYDYSSVFECLKQLYPAIFWIFWLFPAIVVVFVLILALVFKCRRTKLRIPGLRYVTEQLGDMSQVLNNYGTGTPYYNRRGKLLNH